LPKTVQSLIERQIQRSEVLRRAAAGAGPAPCIALSRQSGCGGSELGGRLAKRLGYELYGRELVDAVASEAQVQKRLVEALDEHVRGAIERFATDAFKDARFRESDYARSLVRTIAGIGEHGGAVVVGRGAALILRPERTLRVLLVAPRDMRIERLMSDHGLDRAAAEKRLERQDRDRHEFVEHHFHAGSDDPGLQDLSLNVGSLGVDGCEELILRAFEQRFPAGGRGPGRSSRA
jgi:cytidylate kinase